MIGPSGSATHAVPHHQPVRTIDDDCALISIDGGAAPEASLKLRADVGMVFQSFNLFALRVDPRERDSARSSGA